MISVGAYEGAGVDSSYRINSNISADYVDIAHKGGATSWTAPKVSALLALALQQGFSPKEAIQTLLATAEKMKLWKGKNKVDGVVDEEAFFNKINASY